MQITLEELLRRVDHFERAGDPRRVRSNFVHGLKRLPVTAVR
jgi:cytochrome P450